MFTWVRIDNNAIKQVIVGTYKPSGNMDWLRYPYPCDICSPSFIPNSSINQFDKLGNLLPITDSVQ